MREAPDTPGRPPGPAPKRRRGVMLAVVGALVLVIAVGAFMLQRAMQQQYLEAHRYTFGEVATHLAESGLNLFVEHLRESGLTPGSELYNVLIETGYEDINGVVQPVDSPHLAELAGLVGPGASAEVTVEFRDFAPFQPRAGMRGVEIDPREKHGELAVVSRASFRGVTRTLTASKQVKVVSVVAPVLAKFTLFVRSRRDQEVNILAYDRTRPGRGFRRRGEPARPLVLTHGKDVNPAVVDGRFFSLATVFGSQPFDQGGLVYLGGDQPWYLNLVHGIGQGPYEELFQLRRTRYRIESKLPGVKYEYGLTLGYYDGIFRSAKFGSASAPARYRRPTGEPVPGGTSALHLYGDVGNVSPTLVLGPVFRSYVALRLLDGLWYPFRTEAEFRAAPLRRLFGTDYSRYRDVMVRVVDEAYNRGIDSIASNGETLGEDGLVGAEQTPFVAPFSLAERPLTRVRPAVDGDTGFLYPEPGSPQPGAVRLSRRSGKGSGEDVFRGALADLDGALLEKLLLAKVIYSVKDQKELLRRFAAGGRLELPGIVRVREGDVELPELVNGLGAMLVATGNLTVKGKLLQGKKGQPLTLVSLGGDVRIATGERVEAALVALRGRVLASGRIDLKGAVAAESLDLARLVAGAEPKRLVYNEDLDPTRYESYASHLRIFMDSRIQIALEGH